MAQGSSSSSSSFSRPWREQAPYLKDIYSRAQQQVGNVPLSYYPGSTIAGRDPATLSGEQAIIDRATGGSSLLDAGRSETEATIRGDRFNTNPHLDKTFNRAAEGVTRSFNRAVLPQLESRFAGSNRLGSGAHIGALGEAGRALGGELSGLAERIYAGDYQQERDRQAAAAAGAPEYAAADYMDPAMLQQVGAGREAYSQQQINDLIKRFEFARDEPATRIANYSRLVGAPVQESASKSSSFSMGILSNI